MPATGNNRLNTFRLSIRLGADGLSFSVISTVGGPALQTDRFPLDGQPAAEVLRHALRKPYLMDYQFQSVELVADTPATIVPLEHFNKSDMLAFYRLCFPASGSQNRTPNAQYSVADMHYKILPALEVVMVFPVAQDILLALTECYPNATASCTDAQQLERFASLQKERPVTDDADRRDMYVCYADTRFFLAAFSHSKLLYACSQQADNDSDRAFLLLGIWRALDLRAQHDTLCLQGASKELQATLAEYILNIE